MDKHGALLTTWFLAGCIIGVVIALLFQRIAEPDGYNGFATFGCQNFDCLAQAQLPVLLVVLLVSGAASTCFALLLVRKISHLFFVAKRP